MAGLLLEFHHPLPHVVEDAQRELPPERRGDVLGVLREIPDALVDPVDPDRGKVVAQRAEVALRERVEPAVHIFLDDLALDFQALAGEVEEGVEPRQHARLVAGEEVSETRRVDRHHPDRTGLLGGSEKPVAAFEELAEIQLQAAAHRADHVRGQLGVQEILEIREPVFCRDFKQELRRLAFPRKVLRDVVGGNRKREHPLERVPAGHDAQKRAVDHVHLMAELAVAEARFLPAHQRGGLPQVLGADPVERQVRERRLRAPARGDVEVENKFLHPLLDFFVGQLVGADIRREVGIHRAERLRPSPFVLQRPQKIHHLPERGPVVLRRAGFDFVRDAVEAFGQKLPKRPARAIAGEHVEIVEVKIRVPVRLPDQRRVNVVQPIVRGQLAGRVQYHPAQRISLVRIGAHAPVGSLDVFFQNRGRLDRCGKRV